MGVTMKLEKVIDGIVRYINTEIYSGMSDWQEMLARVAVARVIENTDTLRQQLTQNSFLRTFAFIDDNGDVDIEKLATDVKNQIVHKGGVEVTIPIFGRFVFTPDDVDKICATIKGDV
jgi:hypothetical protein